MESLEDFLKKISNRYYIKLNNKYLYITFTDNELRFYFEDFNSDKNIMEEIDKKRLFNLFCEGEPLFLFSKDDVFFSNTDGYTYVNKTIPGAYSCLFDDLSEKDEYFSLEMEKSINFPTK